MPESRNERKRGKNHDEKDTEIPMQSEFFGEIGDIDKNNVSDGFTENILEDTGRDGSANYSNDDNWDEEI